MYIVTALDGLYVDRQVATRNHVIARGLFNAWAEEWGMYVDSTANRCQKGEKVVEIHEPYGVDVHSTAYIVTTIDYSDGFSIGMSVCDNYREGIRMYLRALLGMAEDGVMKDNDGNELVDDIVFIMEYYNKIDCFNDSVRFDNISMTFRTLKIV